MRISFLLSSLWLSGGVRVIVEYASRLTRRGHDITLVIPRDTGDADMTRELDPRVTIRESQVPRRERMSIGEMVRLSWSMARRVPDSDVVVSTHTPTTMAGLVATRLWRRGRPIWLYQDFREMFVGRPYQDWLLRHALLWHDRALVVSDYSRQELLTYSAGDIVVVGEGLSHSDIFKPLPAEKRTSTNNQQTILFLGDMRARKGLFDFLKAAEIVYEHLKDIRLLIVSKEVCDIESAVPYDYVYRPSRARLARLYATCDLFVSASWRESFGLPPLEALACGAPVVLTDSGGVREYARPGENCLMVPTRAPETLSEAMLRVLSDSSLARQLRRSGPPTAKNFTWPEAVDRFEQALNHC